MKNWYLELIITDEMSEKLKEWEKENNSMAEDLLYILLEKYIKEMK